MAGVTLDAMIKRADFAQQTESGDVDKLERLEVGHLLDSPIVKMLRKPDFQRETNHWSPEQITSFIGSFASGELIPSLIFWKSESLIFVIDGAHRLSALRAWLLDDYGDGPTSSQFYSGEIPEKQKKLAKTTRNKVEGQVGRFATLKDYDFSEDDNFEPELKRMVSTVFTRGIPVQWIQGDQEVAEVSFFKINSQGTPLHKVEAMLLQNRKKSYSIASRSIVRSGTGHKYWKAFESETQKKIETLSSDIFQLLFQPEATTPLRTLDLPIGGNASSFEALQMLLEIFRIVDGKESIRKGMDALKPDPEGTQTIDLLSRTKKVVQRVTGKQAASLGLFPAVFFYNHLGRHSRFLFLGTFTAIAEAVRNNDKSFFREFSRHREKIERILIDKKSSLNQALANINSSTRIQKIAELTLGLVKAFKNDDKVDDNLILGLLGLSGKFSDLKIIDTPSDFSNETKAAALVRTSIESAPRCPECNGLMDAVRGANIDHKVRKQDGGKGDLENAQLMHPYCNSAMKS